MPRVTILAIVCSLAGVSAQTPVTPGRPVQFTLPAVQSSTLFHGDYSHRLTVPAQTTRVVIEIDSSRKDVDVDLFVRYGTDVDLESQVVADFRSVGDTAKERIVIDTPKAGEYYIAYGVFTMGVEVPLTLTVTQEGGGGSDGVALLTSDIPDTCLLSGVRDFTLERAARVKQVYAMYKWDTGESRVDYKVLQGSAVLLSASLTRGGTCLTDGSPWCGAEGTVDVTLAAGPYRMQLANPRACAPSVGGPATIALYGQYLPGPTWQVLSETMVGPGGGTVQGEVSIQVPAGALTAGSRVKLSALDSPEPPSPQRISKIFKVEGIGVNQTQSIEVSVPLTGAPNGPVTVLWSAELPAGLTPTRGIKLLPARVENGRKSTGEASDGGSRLGQQHPDGDGRLR
ncbi:MAG: PPC domain-containing protein [Bryobacteraceae bacterium]|nr:PPC domain-containing protein [Bryobacteraceae bacterium]